MDSWIVIVPAFRGNGQTMYCYERQCKLEEKICAFEQIFFLEVIFIAPIILSDFSITFKVKDSIPAQALYYICKYFVTHFAIYQHNLPLSQSHQPPQTYCKLIKDLKIK